MRKAKYIQRSGDHNTSFIFGQQCNFTTNSNVLVCAAKYVLLALPEFWRIYICTFMVEKITAQAKMPLKITKRCDGILNVHLFPISKQFTDRAFQIGANFTENPSSGKCNFEWVQIPSQDFEMLGRRQKLYPFQENLLSGGF